MSIPTCWNLTEKKYKTSPCLCSNFQHAHPVSSFLTDFLWAGSVDWTCAPLWGCRYWHLSAEYKSNAALHTHHLQLLPGSNCSFFSLFSVSCGNSHVLCDRGVADCVGCSRNGGLAAVAAAAAVQTGHVDPVQIFMVLSSSGAQGLILTLLVTAENRYIYFTLLNITTRGNLCPNSLMIKAAQQHSHVFHLFPSSRFLIQLYF